MNTVIRALVPKPLRARLRRAYNYVRHKLFLTKLFGHYASLIPPLELMYDGPIGFEEFKTNGEEFFRHYTELCDLKPYERILDVGSGIGRKTFLLTDYLNDEGSYEGLDIVKTGIDWCTERITRKYPRFKFQLIDVCNQHYNPTGRYKASEYRFPFADESFDFVVLGSVFTHMVTEEMQHYLCEVARVLKARGRCLITYFLLTPDSSRLIEEKASSIDFRYVLEGCRVKNKDVPEETVAYDESRIRELYQKHGLNISEPIRYGSWCGRKNALSYQDIVVATKPCRPATNNRLQPITG